MDCGDESLGQNGKTVGVVSPDVRAQSDCAKLNVSLAVSPFPQLIVFFLTPLSTIHAVCSP